MGHRINVIGRVGWRTVERFEKHYIRCPRMADVDNGGVGPRTAKHRGSIHDCRCSTYEARPYRPMWASDWASTEPAAWARTIQAARYLPEDTVKVYRAMIEEQGLVPCDYLGCARKASQVWERTDLELRQMSAKRQYRALLREQITGKPHKPRKVSGKGHKALAAFHACDCHVPSWRAENYRYFANLPQVSWEESIPAHWHESAA